MIVHKLMMLVFFFGIVLGNAEKNSNKLKLYRSKTQSYATRLHPNQDIMQTLTNLLKGHNHKAITISSATGSVLYCYIRFANQSKLARVDGPLEVISITGTFDLNLRPHIHITVADKTGAAFGGHLPSLKERQKNIDGTIGQQCPIFTTLEIGLTMYKDLIFQRKLDSQTTYDELTVRSTWNPTWYNILGGRQNNELELE